MNVRDINRQIFIMLTVLGFTCLNSCKGVQKETILFESDFERGVPAVVNNGKVEQFNGSGVLGRYSENGFIIKIENLKPHNLIRITYDLYIHDSWDGNKTGPDGEDIFIMNIDGGSSIYATFANGQCSDCFQSYPNPQPSFVNNQFLFAQNKPSSNAIKTDLPGACKLKDVKGGTSMYKIQRTFEHTGSNLELGCYGQLEDSDPVNKNCNESWSVDNMKITAIEFK